MSGERSWYYAPQRQRIGPVEESVLRQLAVNGTVTPDTLVWTQGMAQWAPLQTIPELNPAAPSGVAVANPAPPPVPPASGTPPPSSPGRGESETMTALLFSIAGLTATLFCCIPLVFSIVGIVLGHLNQRLPDLSPCARDRNRLALILGYAGIVLCALLPLLFFLAGLAEPLGEWFRHPRIPGITT